MSRGCYEPFDEAIPDTTRLEFVGSVNPHSTPPDLPRESSTSPNSLGAFCLHAGWISPIMEAGRLDIFLGVRGWGIEVRRNAGACWM